jgi:hypothetical protein
MPFDPSTAVPTDVDNLVGAITHVESGGNTDATSNQGARGSMQIMPATFKQYAKPGESYDNDADRRAAAIRKINDDYAHFDGDVSKTAAAYIGGRGAVRSDGTIRDDVADGLGTTPAAYAKRVVSRIGAAGAKFDPSTATPVDAKFDPSTAAPVEEPASKGFIDSATDSLADAGSAVASEVPRLGRSIGSAFASLSGGLGNQLAAMGILPKSTADKVDTMAGDIVRDNMVANEASPQYQTKTITGKVAQSLTHMAPAVAVSLIPGIGQVLGVAAFAAQGTMDAGMGAIDQGYSLENAQAKAVGQGLLNTAVGGVATGAANTALASLPVVGKAFVPAAADTVGQLAARSVQGAGTMAVFKPLGAGVDAAADAATGEQIDPQTGKPKKYDFIPDASDLLTGALMVVPHSVGEYVSRNKMPAQPTLFADGSTGMAHQNGSLFSSEKAAQAFVDANNLDGATVVPVTSKMIDPQASKDTPLGFAVKPGETIVPDAPSDTGARKPGSNYDGVTDVDSSDVPRPGDAPQLADGTRAEVPAEAPPEAPIDPSSPAGKMLAIRPRSELEAAKEEALADTTQDQEKPLQGRIDDLLEEGERLRQENPSNDTNDQTPLQRAIAAAASGRNNEQSMEALKWAADNNRPDIVKVVQDIAANDARRAAAAVPGLPADHPKYEAAKQALAQRAQDAQRHADDTVTTADKIAQDNRAFDDRQPTAPLKSDPQQESESVMTAADPVEAARAIIDAPVDVAAPEGRTSVDLASAHLEDVHAAQEADTPNIVTHNDGSTSRILGRDELPIDVPGATSVTRGLHDALAAHDDLHGTTTRVVDSLPDGSDGMLTKDGVTYIAKDSGVNAVDVLNHEMSHVVDRTLGDDHDLTAAADAAVIRTLTPEAKARYAIYYNAPETQSRIADLLTPEQQKALANGGVTRTKADGTWANDLKLTPEQTGELAKIFDESSTNHTQELKADLRAAAVKDPGYWSKFFEELVNRVGLTRAHETFTRLATSVKEMLDHYRTAYANKPSFAVHDLVKNHQEIYEAIAKADAAFSAGKVGEVSGVKAGEPFFTKSRSARKLTGKETENGSDQQGSIHSAAEGRQAGSGELRDGRGFRGGVRVFHEPSGADHLAPLEGLPAQVRVNGRDVTFGAHAPARDAAAAYMAEAGLTYRPPAVYVKVDPARATSIANEFQEMAHAPNSPEVKASYDAMIAETLAQYQAVKKTGLTIELIEGADPYGNPRNAILDAVNNNHLWIYPTESGFGSDSTVDISGNPLLAVTGETINGRPLLANDVFRIVHDYFGHIKEGIGFRADGEENAWQQHAAMYSEAARPAMTAETRGQNSWVNFGPYAEFNKTANGAETQYAPQKIGIMPEWTMREGAAPTKAAYSTRRHDGEMSTRVPSAVKATEDPHRDLLTVGLKSSVIDPAMLQKNVDAVTSYANYRSAPSAKTPAQQAERFIQHATSNLLWLHDQVPEATRVRSKLWYDGARKLTDRWSDQYKMADTQVAAAIAVLSPQKDWYQNVDLARRILDITQREKDTRWDSAMEQTAARIYAKPVYAGLLAQIRGKKFGELDDLLQKATWLRTFDEANNDRGYQIASPEGDFIGKALTKKGAESKVAWGSNGEIAKAISVLEDGGLRNISARLGEQHKVRNFYNNILVPNSQNGHVTIDTHAVAGALLRPLSGSSTEVLHNFGSNAKGEVGPGGSSVTGSSGTYGLYAEAYRRAAKERDILPREMQSITWEAIRGMFTAPFKAHQPNVDAAESVWKDYQKGKVSLETARQKLISLSGGINAPSWERSGAGIHEEEQGRDDQAELSGSELSGGDSGRGDSAGTPERFSTSRSDAAGSGPVREENDGARYGKSQEGSEQVTGVHYSNQPRTSLDSAKYGQGMRGGERKRLDRNSASPEQEQRIHFYTDQGNGIKPESGVGGHAHTVDLQNVYNLDKDPLGLWAQAREAYPGDASDRMNFVEQAAMTRGFDGVHIPAAQGPQGVAVLLGKHNVPVQYQAPAEKRSNARNDNQYSPARPDTWYNSQLSKSMEEAPEKVFGPPKQVAAWLESNAPKLGIKKDELQWSGVTDWLKLQTGKVSKQDVLDYLRQGGVQVTETMKGAVKVGKRFPLPGESIEEFARRNGLRHSDAATVRMDAQDEDNFTAGAIVHDYDNPDRGADATKYSAYQLPGGENYRELLLTLPDKSGLARTKARMAEIADQMQDATPEQYAELHAERAALSGQHSDESAKQYQSSHWDEPDILAHIRFNDRTDADGKKVLFIEELQSDWGQAGLKKGFGGGQQGSVPAGPFVAKTEGWLQLGIKRMISYAAEHGYDKVAFVNGEQSAARYDLSKSVDEVIYNKNSQALRVTGKDGREIYNQKTPPEKLADIVGKEVAEKIDAGGDFVNLSGLDLKVGGEGMKAFYDKIVPQNVNEVLKKLGGGKAGDVHVPTDTKLSSGQTYSGPEMTETQLREFLAANEWKVDSAVREQLRDVATMLRRGDSFTKAMEYAGSISAAKAIGGTMKWNEIQAKPQVGFDITPDLKAKANAGLPLFSRGRTTDAAPADDAQPSPVPEIKSRLAAFLHTPAELLKTPLEQVGTAVVPMSMGSDAAKVVATQFADRIRWSRTQWNKFDEILTKEFTVAQQEKMWNAADRENDLRRDDIKSDTEGLASLTPKERETVELLHSYGEELLQRAKDAGMFTGDGVPYWTPRMVVLVDGDGGIHLPPSAGGGAGGADAKNLRTSSNSLKQRKYLTSAETEAAAQGMNEEDRTASLVRNIRTMPMAMGRLEQAIAGRELVNQIKAIGRATGDEIVAQNKAGDRDYFTMDHPAMRVTGPEFIEDPETGKMRARLDEFGEPVMQRTPLYIRRDFEGPVRAVLTRDSIPGYQALMNVKSKSMGLIMMSPAIHLAVEYGRSLPAMLTSVSPKYVGRNLLTAGIYTFVVGHAAKQDMAQMKFAIEHGLVPLGGNGTQADINGIASATGMEVGRSWTAQALGKAVDQINKNAGQIVRKGVDAAGQFWHETLLWHRIADLQMGLFTTMHTSLVNKGIPESTAATLAAHWANRYAGALPAEAMGQYAREVANVVMFSRSFTLGNIGLMKDMFNGIPPNRQAMVRAAAIEAAKAVGKSDAEAEKVGGEELSQAKKIARGKARQTVVLDIALSFAATAVLQDWLERHRGDKTWGQQVEAYRGRLGELTDKIKADPVSVFSHPFDSINSLTPQGHNPEGKRDRARYGDATDGNTIYVRMPFGKVGEELMAYTTLGGAAQKLGAKLSPMVSGGFQAFNGVDHFGRKIYDSDHDAAMVQVGKAAAFFLKAQTPWDQLVAMREVARGTADDMDKYKAIGPFTGLTFSKVSGGDVLAQEYKAMRDFQDRKMAALPDAKQAVKVGDYDHAYEILEKTGMTPKEVASTLRRIEDPSKPMSGSSFKKMYQHATEEQRKSIDELRSR